MSRVCLIFIMGMISFASLCFSSNTEDLEQMSEQSSSASQSTKTQQHPIVLLKTTMGDIKIELYSDKAPVTVKNFLQYVKDGFFDHTIFHRVIDGFMIQGGGFTKDLQQKTTRASIQNEADNGLSNKVGTIAMARTSDINSATAQFFVNVTDNPFLDFRSKNPREYGYTVFGRVIEGMDVVNKIKKAKTGTTGPFENVPLETIEIIEAKQVS